MSALSPAEIAYEQAHLYQDRRPTIIAVLAVFCGIATATTVGRLVSRWFQSKTFALDDYLIIPGTVLTIVNVIAACFEAHWGYGEHLIAVNPHNFEPIGKWEVVNLWSYIWCISFIKLSILALVYRIFNGRGQQNNFFYWALWFLVGWIVTWLVALCFAFGFECQPFSSQWGLPPDHCTPALSLDYSATILNSVHDVAVFILPQPIVWKLQMPVRKKLTISIIFMIGCVATLMGILRIAFLTGIPGSSHPEDITYNITAATIFTSMEPILAIISANLPAMPTLFQKLHGSDLSQSIRSALTKLVSPGSSTKTSRTNSGGDKKDVESDAGNSDIVIASKWEVSEQKIDDSELVDAYQKKEVVPFV